MTYLKKSVSIILCFIIIFATYAFTLSFNAYGASIKLANIYGSDVNVRTSPSSSSTSIAKISYAIVEVLKEEGDWLKISFIDKYNDSYFGVKREGYVKNVSNWVNVKSFNPDYSDAAFENMISVFPDDYKVELRKLHLFYPNWSFSLTPGINNIKFNDALSLEDKGMLKQLSVNSPKSWLSMRDGVYHWQTNSWIDLNGGWTGASREVIAYYMDPRNFINPSATYSGVFMFLVQNRFDSSSTTEEDVREVIYDSFMNNPYSAPNDLYNGSYPKLFVAVGLASDINPCVLAAKIRVEQGKEVTYLTSGKYPGYEGYYNFFNIAAYGNDSDAVVEGGLAFAKRKEWDTIPKSILEGSSYLKTNYVDGYQNTYYRQNFYPENVNHQYAQNVQDSYIKSTYINRAYYDDFNAKLEFEIPVYKDMPSTPCQIPLRDNTKKNNYYFTDLSVKGLTDTFSMYNYNYNLEVSSDMAIKYSVPSGASYVGNSVYSLTKGNNQIVLPVKSETGFINNYYISVNSTGNYKLYVNTSGTITGSPNDTNISIALGDINSDGKIDTIDMAMAQLHYLKYSGRILSGNAFTAGDVNKDRVIDTVDMAMLQLDYLNIKKIS